MRRTTLAAAVLIPACALALSACGSSGGSASSGASTSVSAAAAANNAHLTSAELNSRIDAAVSAVTAMHIKGSMVDGGTAVTIDLQINKDSAQGTIGEGGVTIPLIAVDGVDYFQLTPSVIKMAEASQSSNPFAQLGGAVLQNRWISSADGSLGASFKQDFAGFTDLSSMTKQLTTGNQDTFTYLGTATVGGQQVAQYKDKSSDSSTPVTTLSVPLTGTALPIQEDGGSQGVMTFVWNQSTTVTAPAKSEIIVLPSSSAG